MSGGAPLWRHRWGVPDTWAVGGQPAQRSDEWGIEKPRRCEGTHRPRGGWGTGVQTAGPRPPAGPGTQAERDASGHSGPRGPARGPQLSRHRGDRSAESPCPDPGSDRGGRGELRASGCPQGFAGAGNRRSEGPRDPWRRRADRAPAAPGGAWSSAVGFGVRLHTARTVRRWGLSPQSPGKQGIIHPEFPKSGVHIPQKARPADSENGERRSGSRTKTPTSRRVGCSSPRRRGYSLRRRRGSDSPNQA